MNSSTQGNKDPYQDPSTTPTPGGITSFRTRQSNAGPAFEHGKARKDHNDAWTLAKIIAISAAMTHIYLPFFINWLGIVGLIFGGCCSNVSHDRQHLGRFDLIRPRCSPWNQSSSECSTLILTSLNPLTGWPSDGNLRAVRRALPCFQLTWPDNSNRTPNHLRPVRCNSSYHMANLLLRPPSAILPQASPNSVDSIDFKCLDVLRCQHAQQLCLWLQHLRPGTYHSTKRRKRDDHARWLRLGETLHQHAKWVGIGDGKQVCGSCWTHLSLQRSDAYSRHRSCSHGGRSSQGRQQLFFCHSAFLRETLIDNLQGKMKSTSSTKLDSEFITGLMILAVAQLLSAIMGIYSELTYSKYGRHWHENLFYQHSLSIPMFYPFIPSLLEQLKKLVHSEPIQLSPSLYQFLHTKSNSTFGSGDLQLPPMALSPSVFEVALPKHVFNLVVNAGTQFACIRGVNALSARTSALGVSIALNVRKLVSLCVSLWLFGNKLPPGVLLGAVIVFGSTSIWAWEGQRIRIKDKRKGKMQ